MSHALGVPWVPKLLSLLSMLWRWAPWLDGAAWLVVVREGGIIPDTDSSI